MIHDCDLPREAIPTQWLNEAVGSVYAGLSRGDERSSFWHERDMDGQPGFGILQLAEQEARRASHTLPEVVARELRWRNRHAEPDRLLREQASGVVAGRIPSPNSKYQAGTLLSAPAPPAGGVNR